jgi:hypothetical protein
MCNRTPFVLFVATCIVCRFLGAGVSAQQPLADTQPQIEQRTIPLQANTRWQDLPLQFKGVFAEPHGRLWYQVVDRRYSGGLDNFKALLAEEFKKPQPQFPFAPVLLEPSGRVWFTFQGQMGANGSYGSMLVGYDGTNFVSRALSENQQSFADPMGRVNTLGTPHCVRGRNCVLRLEQDHLQLRRREMGNARRWRRPHAKVWAQALS